MARYDQGAVMEKAPHDETIFDRMLTNNLARRSSDPKIAPLNFADLADESAMILNGGTEPPANQMAYATYYFLNYTEVRRKVSEELDSVEPDESGRLALHKVENLPYFVRNCPFPNLTITLTSL